MSLPAHICNAVATSGDLPAPAEREEDRGSGQGVQEPQDPLPAGQRHHQTREPQAVKQTREIRKQKLIRIFNIL